MHSTLLSLGLCSVTVLIFSVHTAHALVHTHGGVPLRMKLSIRSGLLPTSTHKPHYTSRGISGAGGESPLCHAGFTALRGGEAAMPTKPSAFSSLMKIIAFVRAQILPIGLVWAILFGLWKPDVGVAFGRLPLIRFAPHGIFFASGLMLRTDEAKEAIKAVNAVSYGVMSILLFTCLIGIKLVGWFPLTTREFSIGAALFFCMPCTIQSGAVLSLKAGGNFALSILITVLCSTGGIFTVPFVLDRIADIGGGIRLPIKAMVTKLVESSLIPLTLGKLVRSSSDATKAVITKNAQLVSLFVTVCIIITPWVQISKSAKAGVFSAVSCTDVAGIVCLTSFTHTIFLAVNYVASRLMGLSEGMTKSVVFVASTKTLPLSLMVLSILPASIGDKGLIALPCILGHFSQIIIDSCLVGMWKGEKA